MSASTTTNIGKYFWGLLALGLLAGTCTISVADEMQRFAKTEFHMAVDFEVVLYAQDEAAANLAFAAAFARIAELNRKLSDYDPESELSRLSARAGDKQLIPLSDDLFAVLRASQRMSEASGGAFDVTVGPLTKLWRRARRQRELPSAERVHEASAAVGHQRLKLDQQTKSAILELPAMRLDLGGIAKGYAVDEALTAIRKVGIQQALVRGSGDIAAADPPPGEKGWKIGLAPLNPDDPPLHFVWLANAAVSTSGDARQHLVVDGRRYSHLIDPRSGAPVEGRSSVTILAPNGLVADSLASAVSVLGLDKGLELVEQTPGAAALLVWEQTGGEPRVVRSNRFPTYEIE